jgi:hypothetical protein
MLGQHFSECNEMLLDLLCYERQRGNLSPEMEDLLETHLEGCSDCRNRILDFKYVLSGDEQFCNFG